MHQIFQDAKQKFAFFWWNGSHAALKSGYPESLPPKQPLHGIFFGENGLSRWDTPGQTVQFWPHSVIHHWKAVHLTFQKIWWEVKFRQPIKRHNFRDVFRMNRNHKSILCRTTFLLDHQRRAYSGPTYTREDAAKGCRFPSLKKSTQMCKPENCLQYSATNYCLCTSEREVLNVVHK